ncbi:MAG: NUDIX hydrolase, partial [Marinirhabdus sp.]
MYKVFVNDVPIILSTEKEMAQCTTVPLKGAKFKKLIKKINGGALHRVNLYHKNPEKIERFLRKKLPVVEAAGGLVFNQKKEILFIKRNNKWDLPKGKIEKNETHEAAAIREVVEETGVQDLKINRFIAQTYHVFKRSGKFKLKVTYWYEMHTGYTGKLT